MTINKLRCFFAFLAASACTTTQDLGHTQDSSTADATPAACSGCANGDGCLTAIVTRAADVTRQPWIAWPNEADGIGSLVVSARQGPGRTEIRARIVVANANMTPSNARYRVELGCVPATTLTLGAFLDDNMNTDADATGSSDYRDSCMRDRQPTRTIMAGVNNEVALELSNTCD